MTREEWKKEESRLKGALTRSKTKVRTVSTLAEKIEAKVFVVRADEALRIHRLNYYELVNA